MRERTIRNSMNSKYVTTKTLMERTELGECTARKLSKQFGSSVKIGRVLRHDWEKFVEGMEKFSDWD